MFPSALAPPPTGGPARVVCVLGCRPRSGAFARRAQAAKEVYFTRGASFVLACGGRAWDGLVEADELARHLVLSGVPEAAVVRELCSLDTRDNARFAAALLARRGVSDVILVTCAWHLARATMLFSAAGLNVDGVGIEPPDASRLARAYWVARERVSSWRDARRKVRLA